jgi:hypothetical protein
MESSRLSSLLNKLSPKAKAIAKATPSNQAPAAVESRALAGPARTVSGNTVTQDVNEDDVPF